MRVMHWVRMSIHGIKVAKVLLFAIGGLDIRPTTGQLALNVMSVNGVGDESTLWWENITQSGVQEDRSREAEEPVEGIEMPGTAGDVCGVCAGG